MKAKAACLWIDRGLHTRLKVLAAECQRTIQDVAEDAVRTKLRELTELSLKYAPAAASTEKVKQKK